MAPGAPTSSPGTDSVLLAYADVPWVELYLEESALGSCSAQRSLLESAPLQYHSLVTDHLEGQGDNFYGTRSKSSIGMSRRTE